MALAEERVQIAIRPARESDRAALEAIAARTWEGHDYLPAVISEWLTDPEGEFFVATLGGEAHVVGSCKLTHLGPGEWWLEGIRVDPDLYGHGIGRALHHYAVERAEALGGNGLLRFCTSRLNYPIHRLAQAAGFSLVAEFRRYVADVGDAQPGAGAFRPLGADDIPAARAFLEASAHYAYTQRSSIGRRWTCHVITDDRLRVWAAERLVHGWHGLHHDPARLDGLVILAAPLPERSHEATITYLDAIPGGLALMAQGTRALVAQIGYQTARLMVLDRPGRLVAVEQAGWRRPYDNSGLACLYSRPLGQVSG